jgi:hypothetical protein
MLSDSNEANNIWSAAKDIRKDIILDGYLGIFSQ